MHPYLHTRLYHGVTNLQRSLERIGTHTLHPKMQQLELKKLNLTKLWKAGFLGINPFSYSSWDTFPEEEEYIVGIYGDRESMIKEFPPRQTIALNPNSLIFYQWPTDIKMYPSGASVWKKSRG